MRDAKWTRQKPYLITIQDEAFARGPFEFKAAASYAASVIRTHLKIKRYPQITVFHGGIQAVEVVGFSKDYYRPRIADGDAYDTLDVTTRGEWQYIMAACRKAGVKGRVRRVES